MLLRSLPSTTRKLQVATFKRGTARQGRANVHIQATKSVLQSFTAEKTGVNLDHDGLAKDNVKEFLKLVQYQLAKDKAPRSSTAQCRIDTKTLLRLCQAAIENRLAWLSVHLLRVAQYQGVELAPLVGTLLTTLIDAREWDGLQDVLKFLRPRTDCTSKLVNAQLRLDLHNEEYNKLTLERVNADYPRYTKLSRETFSILIEARIANRDMEGLRQTLVHMQAKGVEIQEDTHRAILSRMAAIGPNEELENKIVSYLYGINPSIDTVILNHLIRLRSIARDDAVIERYLTMLQNDGESEIAFGPLKPAVPDMTTLALLVEHFARRKNLEGAQRVVDTVDRLGLKPSHELLAHLIYAYNRTDRLQEALTLMSRLLYHLQGPLQRMLRPLLRGLGLEQSDATTTPIPLRANVYIFNAFLSFLLRKRGTAAILPILKLMKYNHSLPDDDTVRIVMVHFSRTEKVGFDVLVQFLYRCLSNRGFKPQIRHVNIMFHALLREYRDRVKGHGGWRAAAARLNTFNTHIPVAPERTRMMFHALDHPEETSDLPHTALRSILASVNDSGARQDHATYSLRMFYHARIERDVETVERLYDTMVQLELRPNAYHVAALLDAHLLDGDIDSAFQRINQAQLDGIKLHPALYTMVICAYGDMGQPEKGLETYKEMMANNVHPDIASLDAVIRGYFLVKNYEEASTLLQSLWPTVLPEETRPTSMTPLRESMEALRREERLRYPSPPKSEFRVPETIRDIQTELRRMAKRDPEQAGPPAVKYFLSKVETLTKEESDSGQTDNDPSQKLE